MYPIPLPNTPSFISDRPLKVRGQTNKQDGIQLSQEDAGYCRLLEFFAEILFAGLWPSTRRFQDFPSPLRVIKHKVKFDGRKLDGWMDGCAWCSYLLEFFAAILIMVSVCRAMANHFEPPRIKQGELPTEETG